MNHPTDPTGPPCGPGHFSCAAAASLFLLSLRGLAATLIMISCVNSPPPPTPRAQHLRYTRSYDEDRHLGLLDMRTEGYNPEVEAELEREEAERLASLAAAHAHDHDHTHATAAHPSEPAPAAAPTSPPADGSPSV